MCGVQRTTEGKLIDLVMSKDYQNVEHLKIGVLSYQIRLVLFPIRLDTRNVSLFGCLLWYLYCTIFY